MSALPVYIWCPEHFDDPQAMLPTSIDVAQMLVDTRLEDPPSWRADGTPFLRVARHIAEACLQPGRSDHFVRFYQDIETRLPAMAARRAIVEVPEDGTYDELSLVLIECCAGAGMVLYDSHGKIWLPDGREFPDDDELMDPTTLLRPLAIA
ncbi:MAG: hypothetical protein Q4A16_09965 [Lautropia sp.]|nr:hypothetical protein [Lautropia sp.]